MAISRTQRLLVGAAVLLVGAGCSSAPAGTGAVDVATQVSGQLAGAGIAADPGSLTCPPTDGLAVGDAVRCDFTSEGQPVGLVARAVSVDGAAVALELSTEPRAIPKAVLETSVGERLGQATGSTAVATVCAADLGPEVGGSTTCTVGGATARREVRVVVSSVDGGTIAYRVTDA